LTRIRYATPDFVVKEGVEISGKKVFWIDAKSYFGSDLENVRIPIVMQASLYVFLPLPSPHLCISSASHLHAISPFPS
jgi:Protein of unknown function TPD sequence-motif